MENTVQQTVENYYLSSPSWPLPRPADMDRETAEFMRDGSRWPAAAVRDAIVAFWDHQPIGGTA